MADGLTVNQFQGRCPKAAHLRETSQIVDDETWVPVSSFFSKIFRTKKKPSLYRSRSTCIQS